MNKAIEKITGKTQEDKDTELLKVKVDRFWENASSSRKEIDWKWLIYDLWVLGQHYAKWDKASQQIITTTKETGRPKVVINKVYTTLRAVRNYTLRNRPKAEVTPMNLTPETVGEVVKINKYLDYLHDKLGLRRMLKEIVWNALKYSVGYWQVLWDEEADEGQGEISVNMIDTYDLYWDPTARHPKEAKYCVLATIRHTEDLINDPKYKDFKKELEGIKGDNLLAASPIKSRLLQAEKGTSNFSKKEKEGSTTLVKEFWIKELDQEKKTKIRIVTVAADKIIRNELTELTRFPFFRLSADVAALAMYGEGWVKNLIPPNKVLDRNESSLAEYNDLLNKGKYVSDKGAGVRIVNNEHGQIIEKKRGFDITPLPIPSLNPSIYTQIENCNRYIEDIGGAHDASMGRIPAGAKSGKALEALQVGDSNNMSEIVENVEEFLEEVYEYILSLASEKYQFARNIIPVSSSGTRDFISVIGEDAQAIPDNTVVIPKKNMVDVKITSWLAHTSEARQEILKELYTLQVIDQQTVLEGFEIGSIADIIQRTNEQKKREMEMQAQSEKMNATAAQGPQAGSKQAIATVRSFLQGQPVQPPTNPSPDFLDYIDQFLASPEAQQLQQSEPQVIASIQSFRDQMAQSMGE